MIYYKRHTGKLLPQKTAEQPNWVQWTHHSEGKTHCEECLRLDGCWFQEEKAPPCPHHPFCHCTLDLIPYAVVFGNVSVYSDYGKFDPYLFNTTGLQTHNKEKLFKEWGYTVDDPRKDGFGDISFVTGWMVKPNGQIKLNTPYGGK